VSRHFSGGQLRAARRAAGLRSDELARACGRSAWTILDYERGRTTPPAAQLAALADALAVPVDALYAAGPAPTLAVAPVASEPDGHRQAPNAAVTVTEYARRIGRSTAYVRRLCQLGQLPARRTERVWLIDHAAGRAGADRKDHT
jgi:transcriptional regulator with XRE-family HTH domain